MGAGLDSAFVKIMDILPSLFTEGPPLSGLADFPYYTLHPVYVFGPVFAFKFILLLGAVYFGIGYTADGRSLHAWANEKL